LADEVIVVDNGSVDGTAEIARAHGVTVLEFPRPDIRHGNIGLVRQKGVEHAKGDIVVSTDADCVYPGDWLEKIERHFTVNPGLTVLGGPVFNSNRDAWTDFIMSFGSFIRSYWAGWGIPYFLAANTSFRKEAFMLAGGYQGAAAHGPVEEWILSFRLSRIGEWLWDDDVYCLTLVPACYRNYVAAVPLSAAPLATWAIAAVL